MSGINGAWVARLFEDDEPQRFKGLSKAADAFSRAATSADNLRGAMTKLGEQTKYHSGGYAGTQISSGGISASKVTVDRITSAVRPADTNMVTEEDKAKMLEHLRNLSSASPEDLQDLWRDAAKSIGVDFDKVDADMKASDREYREREERSAEQERVKMAEDAAKKKAADAAELAELKNLPNFGMF